MKRAIEMKFGWKNVEPVYLGDFSITARYEWDGTVETGDHLVLLDPDGRPFAIARVESIAFMTLRTFVDADYDGHRSYDSIDEAVEKFRGYYPESADDIGPESTLMAVRFQVFDLINGYDLDESRSKAEEAAEEVTGH